MNRILRVLQVKLGVEAASTTAAGGVSLLFLLAFTLPEEVFR